MDIGATTCPPICGLVPDHPTLREPHHRTDAAGNVDLAVGVGDVMLHGLARDAEDDPDLLVRFSFSDEQEDVHLSARQARRVLRRQRLLLEYAGVLRRKLQRGRGRVKEVMVTLPTAPDAGGTNRVGAEHLERFGHVPHDEVFEVGVPLRQAERLELDRVAVQRRLRTAARVREVGLPKVWKRADEPGQVPVIEERLAWPVAERPARRLTAEREMRSDILAVEPTDELVVKRKVLGKRDQRVLRYERAEGTVRPGYVSIELQPGVGAEGLRDDHLPGQDGQSPNFHRRPSVAPTSGWRLR